MTRQPDDRPRAERRRIIGRGHGLQWLPVGALAVVVGLAASKILAADAGPPPGAGPSGTPATAAPSDAARTPSTPRPLPSRADCTRVVAVDAAAGHDVTRELQAFLDQSPAGSVVCLEPGATYRVDGMLHLVNRTGLVIDGRGATLASSVRSRSPVILIDRGGSAISILDLVIEGGSPDDVASEHDPAYQHNHGIAIGGATDVTIAGVTVRNVGGDGVYLEGSAAAGTWASNILVTSSTFDGLGRHGVAITDGAEHVVIEHNAFRRIGYYTLDIEPNGATVAGRPAGASHVRFSDNTIGPGPYGDYPSEPGQAYGYVFVITGASGGGPAENIEIARNVMTEGAFRIGVFDNGGARTDIRILDNVGADRVGGPVMRFGGVDGLRVEGNRQPLLPRATLVSTTNCSSVTIANNVTE